MLKIKRRWNELGSEGQIVRHTLAEFGSIEEQLTYLRRMIEVWRATTWAREKALAIIKEAHVEDRNKPHQAVAIAEWVRKNIRYVNELPETFQTPARTVRSGAGDCDDHTTLIGALAENLGIPIQVVGLKVNDVWQHVYPRALFEQGGKIVPMPLDSTIRDAEIREFANPVKRLLDRGKKVEAFIPPPLEG
jgi:transglutaminase-like putative cysteine protease